MSLPKRSLGLSGVPITATGFGAWALGGGGWAYGWGPQDDDESVLTIRHALEHGVNWIDTAARVRFGSLRGGCRPPAARGAGIRATHGFYQVRPDLG